jgi:hypothetical protein
MSVQLSVRFVLTVSGGRKSSTLRLPGSVLKNSSWFLSDCTLNSNEKNLIGPFEKIIVLFLKIANCFNFPAIVTTIGKSEI